MTVTNKSHPEEFILLGFADRPWLELPLFVILLVTYPLAMMGNIAIILVSILDPCLHSPMYFFLTNLSFLDICYTTSIVPQMLTNLGGSTKTISYMRCVVQLYFFHTMGAISMYLQPPSSITKDRPKFMALFYGVVTPTLNPFIYTLRNKDVKGALGNLSRNIFSSK
ncbi:LOW QUALITY PROTEIN: olfactory receptor 2B11-like isoform X1 [Cricetulus griseus]|uniref:LOW QUALITY PROTEIN: olfactory receptor 2B11-like isoform X1 n=1 Tax=Cricetulus griseus TaxID=10029 RepID=UPI0007DA5262|nr:LOW QUALITY PROTEIN: olfactory receptor 2B11-like isoform X1 [Cricetulus griseus]